MDKDNTKDESKLPISLALPLVAVGMFILALIFACCCYLANRFRAKHRSRTKGYKKVILDKNKDNPLQDTKNETCPVCLDDFKHREVLAICACSHVFHQKCLCKWLRHKPVCPMCMSYIPFRSLPPPTWPSTSTAPIRMPTVDSNPSALMPSQV